MRVSSRLFTLILFYFIFNSYVYTKKVEDIFTCINETVCDELVESQTYPSSTVAEETKTTDTPKTTTEIVVNTSVSTTSEYSTQSVRTQTVSTTSDPSKVLLQHDKTINHTVRKTYSDFCECDLTVASCDINCCCDKDCNEFHLTAFSHCKDHHAELYDSRYCYNRNFIQRNNTPFILEKLANNLFCILYDNLPPTYSANKDLDIKSEKDLRETIGSNKLNWKWESQLQVPEYNISRPYQDGDIIWKLFKTYIQPLELLQSGFSGLCSFKKTIKYLRDWKDQCMQTQLTNANNYLFPMAFNNFTIIVSPHLLNETHIKLLDQICLKNTCLTPRDYYCQDSWKLCSRTNISGSCYNRKCRNVVTGVKYEIIHNGTMGIKNVNVYFNMGNVSQNFYQDFQVVHQWADLNKEKSFALSGNPGYIFGKPVIIGTLKINKTDSGETRHIDFNKTDSFLTLPLAQRSGECDKSKRYVVAFGEDIKLRCFVSLHTNNFSTSSCLELQNRTMYTLIKESLSNVSQIDQYGVYVSKSGNLTKNDTSSWARILLDRVPQNVVTGQVINDRLHCSGLVTSVHLNILYSAISKPESLKNYNILGIGMTFSDESDISWSKCLIEKCTDQLKVDLVNYVTFHEISKPSRYYFVGGPNLDITLPYEFFYPFLSNSKCVQPNIDLISSILIVLCTTVFNGIV